MTRVTANVAREQLPRLLDAVEHGEEVVVEREGREFRLSLVSDSSPARRVSPLIIDDPDVLSGDWTWTAGEDGRLHFQPRHQAR